MSVNDDACALRWRLRGSSTNSESIGLQLPVSCGELRIHLKQQMKVAAIPSIDLLLSLEATPNEVLPDTLLLHEPVCVLVQRKPAAAAAAALKEAEAKYQQQQIQQQQHQQQTISAPQQRDAAAVQAPSTAAAVVAVAAAPEAGAAAGSSSNTYQNTGDLTATTVTTEDERLLLQAVMDVHDSRKGFLRGDSSTSSSRRGLGSHNLMWLRPQEEGGGAATAASSGYRFFNSSSSSSNPGVGTAARQQQQLIYHQQQQYAAAAATAVPPDYICHMCGEMGHHIKACPKSADAKQQKKIRPATGLPSSFLKDISPSEIHKHQEVFIKKDGSFAVLKTGAVRGASLLGSSLDVRIQRHVGGAGHLKCGCCKALFRAPTLTPCCGETFCRACIVLYIQQHPAAAPSSSSSSSTGLVGHCPGCNAAISAADLAANTVLQQSVDTVTCSNSSRWQWQQQQQQQQQQQGAAAAPAAGTLAKSEIPQPGSLADLLKGTVAAAASQDLSAAAAAATATTAAEKTAAATDSEGGGTSSHVKSEPPEAPQAGHATAAAAPAPAVAPAAVTSTGSSVEGLLAAEKTEPLAPAQPAAAAETAAAAAAAASTPQQEDEEALPDLSDLLHFNISVKQILEQHRIAATQIKAYREKRKLALALGADA